MTEADALKALRKAARAFATVTPDVAKGKGRAYEAWVMLALANRLVAKGFTVDAVDSAGTPVTKLRLRKNPAPMSSAALPKSSPGHLVIWRDQFRKHELHLGMQHLGESGSLHEIDLCIIPAHPARILRANGGGPWAGTVCFAFELKAYDETTKLDLGIGRALIGIAHDLHPGRAGVEVRVRRGSRSMGTATFGRDAPRLYIVTTAGMYADTPKLLEWHGGATYPSVVPKSNEVPLDQLVTDMRNHCRHWWLGW